MKFTRHIFVSILFIYHTCIHTYRGSSTLYSLFVEYRSLCSATNAYLHARRPHSSGDGTVDTIGHGLVWARAVLHNSHKHKRARGQWREIVAVTITHNKWKLNHLPSLFVLSASTIFQQPATSNQQPAPTSSRANVVYVLRVKSRERERNKPAFRCFSTAHSAHCVNQCDLCSRTKWCRSFEQSPNSLKRLLCVFCVFFFVFLF